MPNYTIITTYIKKNGKLITKELNDLINKRDEYIDLRNEHKQQLDWLYKTNGNKIVNSVHEQMFVQLDEMNQAIKELEEDLIGWKKKLNY